MRAYFHCPVNTLTSTHSLQVSGLSERSRSLVRAPGLSGEQQCVVQAVASCGRQRSGHGRSGHLPFSCYAATLKRHHRVNPYLFNICLTRTASESAETSAMALFRSPSCYMFFCVMNHVVTMHTWQCMHEWCMCMHAHMVIRDVICAHMCVMRSQWQEADWNLRTVRAAGKPFHLFKLSSLDPHHPGSAATFPYLLYPYRDTCTVRMQWQAALGSLVQVAVFKKLTRIGEGGCRYPVEVTSQSPGNTHQHGIMQVGTNLQSAAYTTVGFTCVKETCGHALAYAMAKLR